MDIRVLRGRANNALVDHKITTKMLNQTIETSIPAIRVWQPPPQIAFGRRDTNSVNYDIARQAAVDYGFHPVERSVGGRAVAYTGQTLAFAHTIPIDDVRREMSDRFEDASETLMKALSECGTNVVFGEPDAAYCPGSHSISSVDAHSEPSSKLAGIAQRVQSGAALVSGCLTVDRADEPKLREVLTPIYRAISVAFSSDTVGSVSSAGGPNNSRMVGRLVEQAFVAGREQSIESATSFVSEQ
jgi:lipoate-protein ligase A